MDSAAPFAGLGFDNSSDKDHRGFGFKGLLGVAFSGKPSVTLASTGGLLTGTSQLQNALIQEQAISRMTPASSSPIRWSRFA
jgi:hypothetical protein